MISSIKPNSRFKSTKTYSNVACINHMLDTLISPLITRSNITTLFSEVESQLNTIVQEQDRIPLLPSRIHKVAARDLGININSISIGTHLNDQHGGITPPTPRSASASASPTPFSSPRGGAFGSRAGTSDPSPVKPSQVTSFVLELQTVGTVSFTMDSTISIFVNQLLRVQLPFSVNATFRGLRGQCQAILVYDQPSCETTPGAACVPVIYLSLLEAPVLDLGIEFEVGGRNKLKVNQETTVIRSLKRLFDAFLSSLKHQALRISLTDPTKPLQVITAERLDELMVQWGVKRTVDVLPLPMSPLMCGRDDEDVVEIAELALAESGRQ
eukprot:gnl/Dysnectes_brevis/3800_a4886_787.p1 GENE.gnl/Dysnectes_brevis/3800_a4886_787~~gnl/Dysnectes_brevis/3800_a4886_787.p1  ORF type:complete len:379 (-),score=49.29 gnl/Dysnectes_brevis/3800_a4886_787:43-1023(-)